MNLLVHGVQEVHIALGGQEIHTALEVHEVLGARRMEIRNLGALGCHKRQNCALHGFP